MNNSLPNSFSRIILNSMYGAFSCDNMYYIYIEKYLLKIKNLERANKIRKILE